jgi:ribosome-binding factor A
VTRAEVSADLQHAKVYVSIMGSEQEQKLAMHGLKHAAGFVQSKLASRLKTRFTPALKFILDEGVKKSIAVSRLINEALAESRSAGDALPTQGVQDSADGPEEEREGHGSSEED